jgi:5-methylcytosine-specific restriction endonuclease McrA
MSPDAALERLVRERAQGLCEYCRMPENWDILPFHVDHIVAEQHRGKNVPGNLALACFACNLHKGPNLAGIDAITNKLVRLFHPRRHKWATHFRWDGPVLKGRTPIGRVTVHVLAMNLQHRVNLRRLLMDLGVFP